MAFHSSTTRGSILRASDHPLERNNRLEISQALAERVVIGIHFDFHLFQIGTCYLFQRIESAAANCLMDFQTAMRWMIKLAIPE